MYNKLIFRGSIFCFFLLSNFTLASEIKVIFEQNSRRTVFVKLFHNDLVLDLSKFDSNRSKNLVLVSKHAGIHRVSFNNKFNVYLYLKSNQNVEIVVDLEKDKFEVIKSTESQQVNSIYRNFKSKMHDLNAIKEPSFESFDNAFDSLASEILLTQNPEIIDWGSLFLLELEKEPSKYMLSLEKFMDFEQLVHERYPDYKFIEMKKNFGVRKDNQSGYYWKY
jgi:hypothetical protein